MKTNTSAAPVGVEDLRQVAADLALAEHHLAQAVLRIGRLAGTGICEKTEGLPLELFIGLAVRMTGADRSVIIGAGQVLTTMPATAELFAAGAISWSQVRRITRAARSLRVDDRAVLDARIAEAARRYDGIDAFGPDQLCEAVDAAADDLRTPRAKERREAAGREANFFSVQRSLFNRVQFFGDYDEVTAAPIIDMLDAAAGRPVGCGTDGEPAEAPPPQAVAGEEAATGATADAGAAAEAGGGPHPAGAGSHDAPRPTRRGGQYAMALADIAAAYLAGGLGATRARPLLNVHVDLSQITVNNAGVLELNVRGPLPRISLATLEFLSRDADCRAVIFDGARPLAVSRKLRAEDIPTDVAFATAARDEGCRWPGSTDPLGFTDNHHIHLRSRGGLHHIDEIVRLSRRYHRTGHDHGWQMRLDPVTGMFTITRGKRRWRSLPRGTPLPPVDRPPPHRRRRSARRAAIGAIPDPPASPVMGESPLPF